MEKTGEMRATAGGSFTIAIPHWRPTPKNEMLGYHWTRGYKLKRQDRRIVDAWAFGLPEATGKRRVSLVVILTGRMKECDPDAYWPSLCDALVHARMLVDDDEDFVEHGPVKHDYGPALRTMILLEDM